MSGPCWVGVADVLIVTVFLFFSSASSSSSLYIFLIDIFLLFCCFIELSLRNFSIALWG